MRGIYGDIFRAEPEKYHHISVILFTRGGVDTILIGRSGSLVGKSPEIRFQ